MTDQIFISYSKKDSNFAHKLADDLEATGFKIWIDRSITGGEQWRYKIESNLRAAGDVVVVLSQNALDSEWVPYEGALAVGWEKQIFPLLIEKNISIPPWLHEVQYINFTNQTYERAFEELKNALTPPNPIQDLLDQQVQAYQQTGELIGDAILRVINENLESLTINTEAREIIDQSKIAIEEREKSELQKAQQLVSTQRQRAIVLAVGLFLAVVLSVISFSLYQQSNRNLSDSQDNAATATYALGLSEQRGTEAAKNLVMAENNAATSDARRMDAENAQATAQAEAIIRATAQAETEGQRDRARAGELASIAISHLEDQLDLAMLLGVEASRLSDVYLSKNALLSALQTNPELLAIFHTPGISARQVSFSPDGKYIIVSGEDDSTWNVEKLGKLSIWELESHELVAEIVLPGGMATDMAFDKQGDLNVIDHDGLVTSLKIPNPESVQISNYNLEPDYDDFLFNSQGEAIGVSYGATTFWNIESHDKIAEFSASFGCENALAFHPTEDWVACGEYLGPVYLIDLENGELRHTLTITNTDLAVSSLAFISNGDILLVDYRTFDQSMQVAWDTKTGQIISENLNDADFYRFDWDTYPPLNVDSGDDLLARIVEWGVEIFFLQDPSLSYTMGALPIPIPAEAPLVSISFSPDERTLAGLLEDGRVLLWNLSPVKDLLADNMDILSYEMYLPPGEVIQRLPVIVTSAAFNPAQTILGVNTCDEREYQGGGRSICLQSTLQLFRFPGGELLEEPIHFEEGALLPLVFDSHGKFLAALRSSERDRGSIEALLWQLDGEQLIPVPLAGDTNNLDEIVFSPDGSTLAAIGMEGVYLWDTSTGEPKGTPIRFSSLETDVDKIATNFSSLAFSPDGTLLAIGGCLKLYGGEGSAIPCPEGVIYIIDAYRGTAVGESILAQKRGIFQLAFSPDGKRLIAAGCKVQVFYYYPCDAQEIRIWDLATRQPFGQPMENYGSYITISTDGSLIASTANWEAVGAIGGWGEIYPEYYFSTYLTIWDAMAQQPFGLPFMGVEYASPPVAMAFTPTGQALLSVDSSGAIVRWNLNVDMWRIQACQRAGRNFTQAEWEQYFPGEPYRKTCQQWPIHPSVYYLTIQEGKALAEIGDIEAAVEKFETVLTIAPELKFDPRASAKNFYIQTLQSDGKRLALQGDVNGAKAKFEEALTLNPELGFDPLQKATNLYLQFLIPEGEKFAEQGDLDKAITLFEQAVALDPELDFDPQVKALVIHAMKLIDVNWMNANKGYIEQVIADLEAALKIDPDLDLSAYTWNTICWDGSLGGYAAKVIYACEKAVALEPQNANFVDSRGLARALINDFTGAIEDFSRVVQLSETCEDCEGFISEHEAWIAALENGQNPFTEDVLIDLRNK